MAKRVRYKMDLAGVRAAALKSDEVAAELLARAERIASAARSSDEEVTVTPHQRRDRVGVYVSRSAAAEAADRALGSAIDAGR